MTYNLYIAMPRLHSQIFGYDFIIDKTLSILRYSYDSFGFTSDEYASEISESSRSRKGLLNLNPFKKLKNFLRQLTSKLPGPIARLSGQAKLSWPGRVLSKLYNKLPWQKRVQRLRKQRRLMLFFTGLLLILAPIAYLVLRNPKPTEAAWWNDSWLYRRSISINYSGDTTLVNFQVELDEVDVDGLNSDGKLNSDCSDLRFLAENGQELDHWIEDESDSSDALSCSSSDYDIWVKVPTISKGNNTIYMYYGNSGASSKSNGTATFDLFDDFDNSNLDPLVWGTTEDTISITNGNLDLLATDDATDLEGLSSVSTFGNTNPQDNDSSVITYRGGVDGVLGYPTSSVGFSNTSDVTVGYYTDDAAAFYYRFSGVGGMEIHTRSANGGSIQDSYLAVGDTNFYEHHITWDGTNSVTFQMDSDSTAHTTQVPNSAQYMRLETTDTINTLSIDHVFVRKLATTSPTTPAFGSYGAEQKGPGTVLYWKLDEGYGSTAHDSSSANNNGTISNAQWRNKDFCLIGNCLYFDGTSDDVSVGDSDLLDFDSSGSFTVQAWVRKPTMTSGTEVVVSKYETTTNSDGGFELYFDGSGDVYFGIDEDDTSFPSDSASDTSADYSDSEWHMITGVKNGTSNIQLYIDGELKDTDASLSASGDISNDDSLYVGARGDSSSYDFKGFIDEVKTYPYARSAEEILADYTSGEAGHASGEGVAAVFGAQSESFLTNGLMGYWPMNDKVSGDSETITDHSGNGFDGTTSDGDDSTLDCESEAGKYYGGCDFDGSDDYIDVGDQSALELTELTISAWVYRTGTCGPFIACSILSKGGSGFIGYVLRLDGGNSYKPQVKVRDRLEVHTGNTPIGTNTWYHVAATIDGERVKIYVNGELDLDETQSETPVFSTESVKIGTANNASDLTFEGKLDELRLYNRALSPTEIKALYEWAPGPLVYYDFNENSGINVYDKSGNNNPEIVFTESADWDEGIYSAGMVTPSSPVTDVSDNNGAVMGLSDSNNTFDSFSDGFDFTFMTWFKYESLNQFNSTGTVIGRSNCCGDPRWRISINSSDQLLFELIDDSSGGNDTYNLTGPAISKGTWYHAAAVWDDDDESGTKLYLNGVEQSVTTDGTHSAIDGFVDGSPRFALAKPFYAIGGSFDEAKVYNYARTAEQIVEDMNAGHPAPGSPVGSAYSHWKFDEGYGSTANDSGTGGNNGSLGTGDSAPAWTFSGKFDKALGFDGTNDYADMGDILDLSSSDDLTLAGWFNRDTATSDNTIIAKRNGISASDAGFIVYLDDANDTLIFEISDGSDEYQLESSSTFTSTGWNHFTVVWDQDSAANSEIYINGNDDNATDTGTIGNVDSAGAGNFRVGTETDSDNPFDGKIDDVRVYNFAVSESQARILYNMGSAQTLGGVTSHDEKGFDLPDPIAHWKLDEGAGTSTVKDYAGEGKDLTMNNFESSDWSLEFDRLGDYALSFDGTDEYLSRSDDDDLDFDSTATYAFSIWFKHDTITDGSTDYIITKAGAAAGGYKMYMDGSGDVCIGVDDDGTWTPDSEVCSSSGNYDDNEWHHAVFTEASGSSYDNLVLHVDGRFINENPQNYNDLSNSNALYVGVDRDGTTGAWEGYMDDIRVYDTYLTQSQASYLYNQGEPIARYKLDECQGTTAYNSATLPSGANAGMHGTINIGGSGTNTTAGTCSSGTGSEAWNNGTTGKRNASLDFDGNDDYISMGDQDSLDFTPNDDFTFEAWVSRASYSTNDIVIAKDDDVSSGGPSYSLYISPSDLVTAIIAGSSGGITCTSSPVTITDSNWNHIVLSFNHETDISTVSKDHEVFLYVNGELTTSCSGNAGSFGDSDFDFTIGAEEDGDNPFDGNIDDVKVHSGYYTEDMVKNLYNEGSVRFGPDTGSP